MAKEEIEVELKAKAGNLQQTLEKMQKTLDKLSLIKVYLSKKDVTVNSLSEISNQYEGKINKEDCKKNIYK